MITKKYTTEDLVNTFINQVKKYKSYNLILAGGKTPVAFYKSLSDSNFKIPKNCILTDERVVEKGDSKSNEVTLNDSGIIKLLDESYVPILTDLKPEKEAERINKILNKDFSKNNICVLGMGKDGHIAGIMKNSNALTSENDFVYADNKAKSKKRLTITKKLIQDKCDIVFLIITKEKLKAFKKGLKQKDSPIKVLDGIKERVIVAIV